MCRLGEVHRVAALNPQPSTGPNPSRLANSTTAALLFFGVLHSVTDEDDPARLVSRWRPDRDPGLNADRAWAYGGIAKA